MTHNQSEEGKKLDRLHEQNQAAADARRPAEAEARGGYLYTIKLGQTPIQVAQHYGGQRRGVLEELLEANPAQKEGPCGVCLTCAAKDGKPCPKPRTRWARWFVGQGILIPVAWGDPREKGDPVAKPPSRFARRIHASADDAKRKKAEA